MRSLKFDIVASLLLCLMVTSADAEELSITESISIRMLELAIVEFDDLAPNVHKSFYDIRLYTNKNNKRFLITGTFNERTQDIKIRVSELVCQVHPRKDIEEWLKKELKEGEFFDPRSMMIAKRIFVEKGILQNNKYVFERQ